jgi:large subunit ribosomal protein L30
MATGMLRVQLVKSGIGYDKTQKATLYGLGLRKRHSIVEVKDSPSARGMIYKVRHLVRVLDGDAGWAKGLQQDALPHVPVAKAAAWKGAIVVPGPKTEPKPSKKAAKSSESKGKKKKSAKKAKKG